MTQPDMNLILDVAVGVEAIMHNEVVHNETTGEDEHLGYTTDDAVRMCRTAWLNPGTPVCFDTSDGGRAAVTITPMGYGTVSAA